MTNEALLLLFAEKFPNATAEQGNDWPTLNLSADAWLAAAKTLRSHEALFFDYLFCVTCIDWKTTLTMVYHLSSTKHRHSIVVKISLPVAEPNIESVAGIWKTADFHEREVYEMFGVQFLQHPDLRLLILPDGWEGRNPMRKDFEDPINMIKL